MFSFITAENEGLSLVVTFDLCVSGLLLLGDEVCAQGGPGILCVEAEELPSAQAVAAPGPEQPARDGPGRAVHTEGGLSGRRGCPGGGWGHRGQPLSMDGGA